MISKADAMNVPPPHNLIVCASNPQTFVRHIVLAAASYVFVLCGAASAQSVPAAPPLIVEGAAEISYAVEPLTTAVLETSASLSLWEPVGLPDYSTQVLHYVPVPGEKQFFRLKIDTAPESGRSRWQLGGSRLVRNTATGVEIYEFDAAGTGNRFVAASTSGVPFTWSWVRTGADTGTSVITWQDGTVETMELVFTTGEAGVFTSEKTEDGLPAGAVAGTFRDDAVAAFAPSTAPDSGRRVITLAGTGRPLRVLLDGAGGATMSNPVGANSFTATYTPDPAPGTLSAMLVLTCQDGVVQTSRLQFTGPGCGTYSTTVETSTGQLRRSGQGAFTVDAEP